MRWAPAGDQAFLLIFDIGDETIDGLRRFAEATRVPSAHFYGIGALQRATLAYWNWDTKRYDDIPVEEQVEVTTLAGNIARTGDAYKVHAHAVLGRRDGSTIGGHLKNGIVRPTLELVVTLIPQAIARQRDATTGLDLVQL